MSFSFGSTSLMHILGFWLSPAVVIMLLLLHLYLLVMRSPPLTVIVQIHFEAVAPDAPAAGRDAQMQEPNDELNNTEVTE